MHDPFYSRLDFTTLANKSEPTNKPTKLPSPNFPRPPEYPEGLSAFQANRATTPINATIAPIPSSDNISNILYIYIENFLLMTLKIKNQKK